MKINVQTNALMKTNHFSKNLACGLKYRVMQNLYQS